MSRLPQIPLQPVARPVDTFLTPSLSKPTPPSLLAELATSLSTINPELQQVLDRRGAAFVEGSQMRAKADAARLRFDNIKAFKAAVDAGQIAESDNPWYMVQLKQEVARHEAETAAAQARVAYYNDPVRFEDDPTKVETFLNQQFAPVVQGRDVWEMEALSPALEQAGHQLVLEHIHNRQDQREQEREVAFQNTASSLIQSLDRETLDQAETGEAAAVQRVQQVQAAVQNLVERSRLTVFGPKLNKWLIEAAVNTGLERKDARLYESILSGIKDTDGSALGSGHEAKAVMEQADERIHEINRRKVRDEREDELLNDEAEKKSAMGTIQQIVQAAGPDSNLLDVKVPASVLSPNVRRDIEVYINGLQNNRKVKLNDVDEEKTKNILQELTNGVTTGTIQDDRKISLLTSLAALGKMSDVLSIASLEDRMRNDKWGPTHPDTEVALLGKIADETLTPGDVLQQIQDGKLDKADGRFYTMEALRIASGKGHGPMAEESYQKILSSLVFAKAADDSGLDDASRIRDDQTTQQKITGAQVAFQKDTRQWLIDHPNATSPEREKAFNELIDTTAKKYGGYGYQEWQDRLQKKTDVPKPAVLSVTPGKAVDPVLTPTAVIDPLLGKLTNEDLTELKRVRESSSFVNSLAKYAFTAGFGGGGAGQVGNPDVELYSPDIPHINHDDPGANSFLTFDPFAKYLAQVEYHKDILPVANDEQQTELETMFKNALRQKKAIRFAIQNQEVVNQLKSNLAKTRLQFNVSPDDKRRVMILGNLLQQYSLISQSVGYSVDEVKTMPPKSWTKVRLFANEMDLNRHGQDVATELGLTDPKDIGEFIVSQKTQLGIK